MMKVKEKLMMDRKAYIANGPINIVIFGDSVSHGALNGFMDYENVYWNQLRRKLNAYRDYVPVNMINASISGTSAKTGVSRMEKQVLSHGADLVIVCFGLNDVNDELDIYLSCLREIFTRCRESGSDVIFMTPNMLNTYVADDTPYRYYEYAHKTAAIQNEGRMDRYMDAAVALANEMNVPVADCYAKWKKLSETSDTTMLLANRINHPVPAMHTLFADTLYEVIMGEEAPKVSDEDTMFRA